ncbi:hypothetical protein BGY98DRAFT_970748 [Russula aff. rugulosa BPL654]|nr:hypothetical protein BGY98DRAFT_970748 [Russula aff. rugulosa BPL654]
MSRDGGRSTRKSVPFRAQPRRTPYTTTAGITLRAVIRANGTAKVGPRVPPSDDRESECKRRATPWAHDEFIGRLEGYLTTGEEDIGMSFTKTIKDMYPDSSKKHAH